MAMSAKEFKFWAEDLPDDARVAVDDGGLRLVTNYGHWLDLGGIPEDEEESWNSV